MELYKIHFEKVENLRELKSRVDTEQLIICDNMQNTFLIIKYDDVHCIGIAYYDYGIAVDFMFSQSNKYLYLGAGIQIIIVDMHRNIIVKSDELDSVFYELIYSPKRNEIYALCELGLYCYCNDTLKWKIGLRDIVIHHSVIDDSKILIKCDDGIEYLFSLEDGKLLG